MFPVTWADVAKAPPEGRSKVSPVTKLAAAGLSPMFPVMADVGTLEIADFARITYVPAVPSTTGAGPCAPTVPMPGPAPGVVGDWLGAVLPPPQPAATATSSNAIEPSAALVRFPGLLILLLPLDPATRSPRPRARVRAGRLPDAWSWRHSALQPKLGRT